MVFNRPDFFMKFSPLFWKHQGYKLFYFSGNYVIYRGESVPNV